MAKTYVSDLKNGDTVTSTFSIKYKKPPKKYSGGYMFEARLADKSGEITAKYWGGGDEEAVSRVYESFDTEDVIEVTGRVSEFRGKLEVALDDKSTLKKLDPLEYDLADFIATTEKDIPEMYSKIKSKIDSVDDHNLKSLLLSFFDDPDFSEKFNKSPGSMSRHQNYVGGLLEHTLNVTEICEKILEIHPKLDRNLLITGAILHDIGKIYEYTVSTNIDVSREGMLRGHLIIGESMAVEKIKHIPEFPKKLALKVSHMILSHHGQHEYGSPKKPQLPEAFALYYADELDAKVSYVIHLKEDARTEDPWVYTRDFGHIYLE